MRPPVPSLENRLCLVTGAASGIGLATARAAARQGAHLVLTDISPLDDVNGELGDSVVLSRSLDITDIDAVRQLADDVHASHGSVDVAMNIAGIATWGAVENLTHEQWRRTIDVNLMGPIHVIESFVPGCRFSIGISRSVVVAGVGRCTAVPVATRWAASGSRDPDG